MREEKENGEGEEKEKRRKREGEEKEKILPFFGIPTSPHDGRKGG